MIRFMLLALCTLLLSSITLAEWNEPNVAGAKEHPLLKFYPESSVYEYDYKEFDSAPIIVSYTKGAEEPAKVEAIEGKVTKYSYYHKPNTSALEIVRQYEGALQKVGFVTIIAGKEIPGTDCNTGETIGSFRLDKNGKPAAYVMVHGGLNDSPQSTVVIVEVKQMEQKLEADAGAMFDELTKSGRVSVYGINFERSKALITPDSEKVLGEVKKLIAAHPELKLKVEGHTDNVGDPKANQKLSEERAAAVKDWLVKNGAKGENLSTAGFGSSKPLGENNTEAGKAKNRRVELVKQ